MTNMLIYTNKFDRISSRKGNVRNFIISTSVCDCAECACWLSLVMRHCQFIFWYVTLQQPQMGMISSAPDVLSYSNTTECWLLLRQCSGTALVYLWESVLVLGKKVSLLISFEASHLFILSLNKRWYHTQGRYKKMLVPCFDPGLDWNILSGLGYSTTAFLYP